MTLPASGFGLRAERERRGLPAEPPDRIDSVQPEPEPRRKSTGGSVEITVTPVIDQEALVAVCNQIAESVRAAFHRGVAEGLADAERMIHEDGE